MVNWEQTLKQKWATLHFGDVTVETRGEQHVFEVQVYLNDLDPKAVRVELYADGVMGSAPRAAGDDARAPTGRRVGRLRVSRGGACSPPASGLYGASDTALRRRGGAPGSRLTFSGSGESPSNGSSTTEGK